MCRYRNNLQESRNVFPQVLIFLSISSFLEWELGFLFAVKNNIVVSRIYWSGSVVFLKPLFIWHQEIDVQHKFIFHVFVAYLFKCQSLCILAIFFEEINKKRQTDFMLHLELSLPNTVQGFPVISVFYPLDISFLLNTQMLLYRNNRTLHVYGYDCSRPVNAFQTKAWINFPRYFHHSTLSPPSF